MEIRSVVLVLLLTAGSAVADIATISFDSLSQPGSGLISVGGSVSQDGFTFSSADARFRHLGRFERQPAGPASSQYLVNTRYGQ
jgi:hypothetical protein